MIKNHTFTTSSISPYMHANCKDPPPSSPLPQTRRRQSLEGVNLVWRECGVLPTRHLVSTHIGSHLGI